MNYLTQKLDWIDVNYWFYILNDLSLFYIILPFFIIELIRYFFLKKMRSNLLLDSLANLITFCFFLAIEFAIGILAVTKIYFWVYQNYSLPHLELNWVTIITCILLADLVYYWEHRLMHRIGIGWATHIVHHSSPHFNMSVAYRFGPLDAILPIILSIPLTMLGYNPILIFSVEIFVQVFQTLLHTEIIKKLPRPIEFFFNTPSHHRVHHGSNKKYWDKNYAGILIIWDRMFGTFEKESETVIYGTSNPINSTNPFVIFLHGIIRFWQKVNQTKGILKKLLTFIKPPSWNT